MTFSISYCNVKKLGQGWVVVVVHMIGFGFGCCGVIGIIVRNQPLGNAIKVGI